MLLNTLVDAPPEVYTFQSTPEEIADSQMGRKSSNRAWSSVDAVRRLLILSDSQRNYPQVQTIFSKGISSCPEVVMLSLVRVQPLQAGSKMCGELTSRLLPLFFKPGGSEHTLSLMKRLWGEVSPTVVVNGIVESWRSVSKNNEEM